MSATATQLRADLYKLLDQVLESGKPLEIRREGQVLWIVPAERRSLWELFPPRPDRIIGDPDDLVHIDWSKEWRPSSITPAPAPKAGTPRCRSWPR